MPDRADDPSGTHPSGTDVAGTVPATVAGFARALRHAGLACGPQRVQTMLAALSVLGLSDPVSTYWAGRLSLCAEPDDIPIYDAVFAAFFGGRGSRRLSDLPLPVRPKLAKLDSVLPTGDVAEVDGEPGIQLAVAASRQEVLRQRDLAALSPAERDEVRRLIALLAPATSPRRSRRSRPARTGAVDRAGTIRRMLRQSGEPTRLARVRRQERPRRLVLLIDVSGSMAPYSDALLRFAHAAVRRRPLQTEVFTLGTRLTRVTRALRHRDPDLAMAAVGSAIPDWHGGTRLADALRAFQDRWGRRGTARGAVVVVCSDGWERGEPDRLAEQVAQLSRLAYRMIWVNPHRGKAGFAPLAAGMAAVLPYLDAFVAGHSLAALEELVTVIARP